VGADMLNRGFTIEHLSMSYMPRTTKGKSNADTIEQRCRFFGYKMNYIDVCRVYLSTKSLVEYNDYVDHEENLRANLNQCESLAEFSKHTKSMLLADTLNPTRNNILSSKLVRNKLSGWKQMISLDCHQENKERIRQFLDSLQDSFTNCQNYNGNGVLIIDCAKLTYISSAGLRVLLSAQKKTKGTMKLINVCELVMEVFEMTGFVDILTIE
jgi:anti-anti-sigma factor